MINYGVFATPTMENNDLTHYLHIIHQSSTGDGVSSNELRRTIHGSVELSLAG